MLAEKKKYAMDTLEAMKEIEDMEKNPDQYKGYANTKEMIEDIRLGECLCSC